MTEAEQNLRKIYRTITGDMDEDVLPEIFIREVALATLKDIRPYLELAHQTAEARYDGDSEDRGSYAMYDIMYDAKRLIEQIDLLLQVASE